MVERLGLTSQRKINIPRTKTAKRKQHRKANITCPRPMQVWRKLLTFTQHLSRINPRPDIPATIFFYLPWEQKGKADERKASADAKSGRLGNREEHGSCQGDLGGQGWERVNREGSERTCVTRRGRTWEWTEGHTTGSGIRGSRTQRNRKRI